MACCPGGGVVEFWQVVIKPNWIVVEEIASGFEALLIRPARDLGHDSRARGRLGAADEVLGHLDRFEHDGLEDARDVAEHSMIDWIVLRAAGRIVGHLNVAAQAASQIA